LPAAALTDIRLHQVDVVVLAAISLLTDKGVCTAADATIASTSTTSARRRSAGRWTA
jgi:hypothetical protein